MASILQEENQKVFAKEPMDKELLLSSLRDFCEDGTMIGVEKVIQPKLNGYGKVTISTILKILGEMPKARKYVLDEEGQYTFYTDDKTGEERRDIEVGEGHMATVFFPFYAVPKDTELDDETTLVITPATSSYSFFREAYINAGELPSDMGNMSFSTNFKEMKDVVEGFVFIGKHKIGGTKRKFPYLYCERVEE